MAIHPQEPLTVLGRQPALLRRGFVHPVPSVLGCPASAEPNGNRDNDNVLLIGRNALICRGPRGRFPSARLAVRRVAGGLPGCCGGSDIPGYLGLGCRDALQFYTRHAQYFLESLQTAWVVKCRAHPTGESLLDQFHSFGCHPSPGSGALNLRRLRSHALEEVSDPPCCDNPVATFRAPQAKA